MGSNRVKDGFGSGNWVNGSRRRVRLLRLIPADPDIRLQIGEHGYARNQCLIETPMLVSRKTNENREGGDDSGGGGRRPLLVRSGHSGNPK